MSDGVDTFPTAIVKRGIVKGGRGGVMGTIYASLGCGGNSLLDQRDGSAVTGLDEWDLFVILLSRCLFLDRGGVVVTWWSLD